eukprot:jgi/Bigna1/131119/aug1.13_g5827
MEELVHQCITQAIRAMRFETSNELIGFFRREHRWNPPHNALLVAVDNSAYHAIESLVRAQADINHSSSQDELPLVRAVMRDDANMVQWLLSHNADVFCRGSDGKTAREKMYSEDLTWRLESLQTIHLLLDAENRSALGDFGFHEEENKDSPAGSRVNDKLCTAPEAIKRLNKRSVLASSSRSKQPRRSLPPLAETAASSSSSSSSSASSSSNHPSDEAKDSEGREKKHGKSSGSRDQERVKGKDGENEQQQQQQQQQHGQPSPPPEQAQKQIRVIEDMPFSAWEDKFVFPRCRDSGEPAEPPVGFVFSEEDWPPPSTTVEQLWAACKDEKDRSNRPFTYLTGTLSVYDIPFISASLFDHMILACGSALFRIAELVDSKDPPVRSRGALGEGKGKMKVEGGGGGEAEEEEEEEEEEEGEGKGKGQPGKAAPGTAASSSTPSSSPPSSYPPSSEEEGGSAGHYRWRSARIIVDARSIRYEALVMHSPFNSREGREELFSRLVSADRVLITVQGVFMLLGLY